MNTREKLLLGAISMTAARIVANNTSSDIESFLLKWTSEDTDDAIDSAYLLAIQLSAMLGVVVGATITSAGYIKEELERVAEEEGDQRRVLVRLFGLQLLESQLSRAMTSIGAGFFRTLLDPLLSSTLLASATATYFSRSPMIGAGMGTALMWGYSALRAPLNFFRRPPARHVIFVNLDELNHLHQQFNQNQAQYQAPRQNVPENSSIIKIELDKLILLDPAMVDYDFDDHFICPISYKLMLDPVIVIDSGHTYDRQSIERWFEESNIDPTTKQIVSKQLVSNIHLRTQILDDLAHLKNDARARNELSQSRPKMP